MHGASILIGSLIFSLVRVDPLRRSNAIFSGDPLIVLLAIKRAASLEAHSCVPKRSLLRFLKKAWRRDYRSFETPGLSRVITSLNRGA
jgi:hypothetical protein